MWLLGFVINSLILLRTFFFSYAYTLSSLCSIQLYYCKYWRWWQEVSPQLESLFTVQPGTDMRQDLSLFYYYLGKLPVAFLNPVIVAQLARSASLCWQLLLRDSVKTWALLNTEATDRFLTCPGMQPHKNYWSRFASEALTMGTPSTPLLGELVQTCRSNMWRN